MLEIIPVTHRKHLKEFARLPETLYSHIPHWIPPLRQERLEVLSPKKNPYYQHAKVQLFLAKRNGKTVGRISAQVDEEYEKRYGIRMGHFGFFECENHPETAQLLFKAAEKFCHQLGAKQIMGPFDFSINEELGLMIEGFEQPLMIMMPYHLPYYAQLIERLGYQKAKDLYAWKYEVGEIPKEPGEIAEQVYQEPGLKIRNLNPKNFHADISTVLEIFNSVWENNWGFIPFTPAELEKISKDLKLILDPDYAFIAEVEGKPVGICVLVPNLYDMIHDLKGKLFPWGIFKLFSRIKKRKYHSGRLMLLGVKKDFRGAVLGGLSILLYVEILKRGIEKGLKWGELSWTLEDNLAVNASIEFMGGKKYKTYRIYQKQL